MKKIIILVITFLALCIVGCSNETHRNEWVTKGNNKFYYDDDGKIIKNQELQIGSDKYFFDSKGRMAKGFTNVDGKKKYYDENGKLSYGWKVIDGTKYYLNEIGQLQTKWVHDLNNWYYIDPETCTIVIGWKEIDNSWYYFDVDGKMFKNWQSIDDAKFYFDDDGKMLTGWKKISGNWYLFDNDGKMQTGWQDNNKYFLDTNGKMLKNTTKNIDGVEYIFDESGVASVKPKVSEKSNNYSGNSSANEKFFVEATNASQLNNLFEMCKNLNDKMYNANSAVAMSYAIQLKAMAQNLQALLNASYRIDSMKGNSGGVAEEKVGYMGCEAFIELAKKHGAY